MIKEKIINDFLEKNCEIFFGEKGIYFINYLKGTIVEKILIGRYYDQVLIKIFPDGAALEEIYLAWVSNKIKDFESEIYKFLNNYDLSKGSTILLNVGLEELNTNEKWPREFLVEKFKSYYVDKIKDKLLKFIKKNDKCSCDDLISKSVKRFKAQELYDYITISVVNYYKTIIDDKIENYLKTININDGSKILSAYFNANFRGDDKYFSSYLVGKFSHYYRVTYLNDKLNNLLNSFSKDDKKLTLDKIFSEFKTLHKESETEKEYCVNTINQWFLDNITHNALDDFFNQLVITLGSRDWTVTWIGHGPLTTEKLFKGTGCDNENGDINKEYVQDRYDKWYSEAIINASEKYMDRTSHRNWLP